MSQTKFDFAEAFKKRTKKFAVDVIHFSKILPRTDESLFLKVSYCGQLFLLPQITGQFAGRAQQQNSMLNFAL